MGGEKSEEHGRVSPKQMLEKGTGISGKVGWGLQR